LGRKRNILDFVRDISDAALKVYEFTNGMDLASFQRDERTVFAVVRALEVIGEAANRIPNTVQERYPNVPWRDMVDMRNKVIHDYFGVDVEVVWRTVCEDIPPLRAAIAEVLQDMEGEK